MKKIFLGLFVLVIVISVSAGAVFAWFSSSGKVRGLSISVASSNLLVNGQDEWNAGANFTGLYPGWETEPGIDVAIKNNSDADIPLEVKGRVLFSGVDFQELADTMLMAIEPSEDVSNPDFQTLTWWSETGKVLPGGNLDRGTSKNYTFIFKLPLEAGNSIQGDIVDIEVLLTGTQVN